MKTFPCLFPRVKRGAIAAAALGVCAGAAAVPPSYPPLRPSPGPVPSGGAPASASLPATATRLAEAHAAPAPDAGQRLPCKRKHRHGLRYSVRILQTPNGMDALPTAINNHGWVVGYSAYHSGVEPTLWINGQSFNIVGLGGTIGFAHDINDAGTIAGSSQIEIGSPRAFTWRQGQVKALPSVDGDPASFTNALGINRAGVVVGEGSVDNISANRAARWRRGQVGALEQLAGGAYSIANAVNDAGFVVGASNDAGLVMHAALWRPGGDIVDLGANAVALDIDNAGRIVGYTFDGMTNRPAKWTRGIRSALPTLGGETGVAFEINARDETVGLSQTATGAERATIWFGAKPVQLDTLLDESGAGMVLEAAYAINDKGQIAAVRRLPNFVAQPVVLTPQHCHGG